MFVVMNMENRIYAVTGSHIYYGLFHKLVCIMFTAETYDSMKSLQMTLKYLKEQLKSLHDKNCLMLLENPGELATHCVELIV